MLSMLRNRRQKGFTLIELLIVIAIIGIIAALLIPNFLDSLQKGKQKRTMGDMKNIGTAMFAYVTDILGAAAAGQLGTQFDPSQADARDRDALAAILVPQYIQTIPENDGWKTAYLYGLNDPATLADSEVMSIVSLGRLGAAGGGPPYTVGPFNPTDYEQDLVWGDGFWVRWPSGDANTQ